ncbi:MAG: cytochrome c biogenesis protein CcdA [Treponema sp.]|jgi:cytochrome c-type biogenesis protein|nr:cytochrome c biogenesis protein CcdA [Treponema sp.]
MTVEIPFFMAFVAGLLSFLSPCVLPLIPSYFSILGGGHSKNGASIWTAVAFVLGFSAVFIAMGILLNTVFFLIGGISLYINIVAGIIVIILGLNVIFDFLIFLNYEKRPFLYGKKTAFIAGVAFGAGWTPCVGPVLTAILLMAGQSGKILSAVFYLALYSAGMALPFILAALFFDFFMKQMARLRSGMVIIRYVSGILLVLIGIMILTGRYSALNGLIQTNIFRYINWAEAQALPFRLLAQFFTWLQNF